LDFEHLSVDKKKYEDDKDLLGKIEMNESEISDLFMGALMVSFV